MDVRYKLLNDEMEKGNVEVKYTESREQTADILIKALSGFNNFYIL